MFLLGWAGPFWLIRLFPGSSPFAVIASSIASQRWLFGLYWAVPPLLLIGLALWKGRFFCRWVCPLGTVYAVSSSFSAKRQVLRHSINGYLFWTIIAASVVGFPLLLLLDPLSTFNRWGPLTRGLSSPALLIPLLLVPLFFLLGFLQPYLWCVRICPLGYFFEFLGKMRRRGWPKKGSKPDRLRREIVVGIFLGAPLGLAARRLRLRSPGDRSLPVLPPGAIDQAGFSANCSRCYSCVSVCPTKVIRIKPLGESTLIQAFQPGLDTDRVACSPQCNRCSQVCPTAALLPLTLEEKRRRQIGLAHVRRAACLAWTDEHPCMLCEMTCPYIAIDAQQSPGGLPSPLVNEDVCRGCGACQNVCPGNELGKAITVHGIERQRELP